MIKIYLLIINNLLLSQSIQALQSHDVLQPKTIGFKRDPGNTSFFARFASPNEGGSSRNGVILLPFWTDSTAVAARMVVLKGIPSVLSPELLYALAKMGHGDELGMTHVKSVRGVC